MTCIGDRKGRSLDLRLWSLKTCGQVRIVPSVHSVPFLRKGFELRTLWERKGRHVFFGSTAAPRCW